MRTAPYSYDDDAIRLDSFLMTAVWMAAGSLAGVYPGSHMTKRVPEKLLKAVVVTLVVAAGIAMLIR